MIELEEKSSPLTEYYESLGYKSQVINGRKIIKNFNMTEIEMDSLYDGVGLRDISHYGILELKGNDSLDFLHRITTNSIKDLPKEGIENTIFTSEKGRIIDFTTVINFEDYQLLVGSPENQSMVYSWIEKYIIADDVKVTDVKGKYTVLELIGPQADSFVTLICGNIVNAIKPDSFKVINADGMIFFLLKILDRNEKIRFWLIANIENGQQLVKYMIENKGIFNFSLIGDDAYNIYRIEHGIPAAPNEINFEHNPHEARLLNAVDFNKGCYIGQEVIARLDTYDKVKRYLSGIIFSGAIEQNEKYLLFDENDIEAGIVTSTCYSLKLKNYIGLAYIKRDYMQEETVLTAKSESGNSVEISVKTLPFRR
ncbi:MAG: glycine cleavage T C-terminal barrel domain-containing protein [Ignavibacteriaceae bacterium]